MRNRLGYLRKQRMGREFTKNGDIRENQITSRRHGFIHRMAEPFGC